MAVAMVVVVVVVGVILTPSMNADMICLCNLEVHVQA